MKTIQPPTANCFMLLTVTEAVLLTLPRSVKPGVGTSVAALELFTALNGPTTTSELRYPARASRSD
jgi:hypothetical protein